MFYFQNDYGICAHSHHIIYSTQIDLLSVIFVVIVYVGLNDILAAFFNSKLD